MDTALLVGLLLVLGWALTSRRLERWSITAPIAFLLGGYCVGRWASLDLALDVEMIRRLAEFTLVLVLFRDAAGVRLSQLRHDAWLPTRLLAVGLPLTIAAGAVTAALLFPGHGWWMAALIGAILAPTDAALGASIMNEERIPLRLRTLINVESGLNDGLATPFVLFFLTGAVVVDHGGGTSHVLRDAVSDLVIAIAVGIAVGFLGRRIVAWVRVRDWSEASLEPVAVLALAMLSYVLALALGGNGFVAAFVGGLAFGNALPESTRDEELTEQVGRVLGLAVWFGFGLIVVLVRPSITWQSVIYALLSLTVIRMLPVLLALWRSGLGLRDALLVGWLGPRGLASIVFAILAVEALTPGDANLVAGTVTVTVALSVFAHGLSAGPLARRYAAAPPRQPAS